MKKILLILSATLVTLASFGTDYTIFPDANVASYALPIYMGEQGSVSSFYGSITQSILLASELLDEDDNTASKGDITDISFYYTAKSGYSATAVSRSIAIYLMEIAPSITEYSMVNIPYEHAIYGTTDSYYSYFLCNGSNKAGQKVFDGTLSTEDVSSGTTKIVKLTLSSSFHWDGSKNIVMTVLDKSATTQTSSNLRFWISSTKEGDVGHPRFAYTFWKNSSDERVNWITDGNYNFSNRLSDYYGSNSRDKRSEDSQKKERSYVPKVTFSISPAAVTIPAPENLEAENITTSSATLTWDAVTGATSYNVRWGKISGSLDHGQSNVTGTSLPISDLEDGETYYFDVQAITSGGTSAYANEANFETTAITHEHDGITFSKWSSTTSMPTSGNYYLKDDVSMDPYAPISITLTGNLNLCLNGNTANIWGSKIVVPDGKTLTIYDNVGGGKLTGFVESVVGGSETYSNALIVVYNGGVLVLKQGTIENTYSHNPEITDDGYSYAIYSNGTVRLSGNVLINSNDIDIYLYASNIITLDGALSNADKHTVYKNGGAFTSGWSTYMSSADPRNYFESANSARSVYFDGSEAALRLLLNLSENSLNSAISTSSEQVVDVELTRSTLYSAYYNTICLPFALSNAQLEEYFGAGYDLEEFVSSSLDGDLLNLTFNQVTALEAGKPYLLKPTVEVTDPSFIGVTITATSPVDITTNDVYFHGTYRPTELTGGNLNILFLYPDNELRWPAATENLKGFRAYFEIIGETSAAARRARIVTPSGTPTAVEAVVDSQASNRKWLKDGQIIIERNGRYYNITGQRIH